MIRRLLATMAVSLAAVLVIAPQASAQYEGPCGFVLEESTVSLDGTVHVLGAGFEPNSEVTFEINGVFLGTTTVGPDSDGPVDAIFPLPAGLGDGEYVITTTCEGTTVSQSVVVGSLDAACNISIFQPGTFAELTLPGFDPGSSIEVVLSAGPTTLYSGPVTGNPMTVGITFPTNVAAGQYFIDATGTNILGQPLTVTCPVTAQVTEIPVTGSDATVLLVRIGLGLLTAGGILFVAVRRRSAVAA